MAKNNLGRHQSCDPGHRRVGTSRLLDPRKALHDAGASTMVVSPKSGKIRGWNHQEWGNEVPVDIPLNQARAQDFHALLLPGGVMNPDRLRIIPEALAFVKHFRRWGKPVAAICHGPWTLTEADAVRGPHHDLMPLAQNGPQECRANSLDAETIRDNNLFRFASFRFGAKNESLSTNSPTLLSVSFPWRAFGPGRMTTVTFLGIA